MIAIIDKNYINILNCTDKYFEENLQKDEFFNSNLIGQFFHNSNVEEILTKLGIEKIYLPKSGITNHKSTIDAYVNTTKQKFCEVYLKEKKKVK